MQDKKIYVGLRSFLLFSVILFISAQAFGQVSSVEFGKNRLQFKKLHWEYYQTLNFNCYYYQGGEELAKYVLQVAEEELPDIEKFIEYSLQLRANIMIYNSFDEMRQSNIGLGIETKVPGGTTVLVNNKMVVYFNGNHADLRKQIREGIAKILTQNLLFGDDLGEMASNTALLDLPDWLVDGYVAYVAENWSPQLDAELRGEILSYKYKNFYQLAFDKPQLAGHAFWYFIEEKYKRENTTYLLYLTRMYKSLSRASSVVTKIRKFKDLLKEFMAFEESKYEEDIRKRKDHPKGSEVAFVRLNKRTDFYNYNVNPNKRNLSYGVVRYKKGQYKLILDEEGEEKILLKIGSKTRLGDINPAYPKMAWDPKGTRLAVIYEEEGRLKLFVYDVITKVKPVKRDLTDLFDQIQSMQYIYNSQQLLFSAVKNGHTDIYIYDMENETVKAVTNDAYDNLDASFVGFPNKTGILFSSNRPDAIAAGSDTSLMSNRFNIFMVTDFSTDHPELNQITQLTDLEWGDARFPTQYNDNHFTFVTDANGIMNRYAGFFSTKRDGLDTLVLVGNLVLRNPDPQQIDSVLVAVGKDDVDSIAVVSISKDSAYSFPLTNYSSGIVETAESGDTHQVSEVTRSGDEKILYKLKVDEATLRRRNVTAQPTTYRQKLMEQKHFEEGHQIATPEQGKKPAENVFQQQFEITREDTMASRLPEANQSRILRSAKKYPYKPKKFSADFVTVGFNNEVLGTRYQPYQGGQGPVQLSSDDNFNGMIRVGTSDLMEDIRLSGGLRLGTNLKDNDWMFKFDNLRNRIDWGLLYYRSVLSGQFPFDTTFFIGIPGRMFSDLYEATIAYPFDMVRSVRLTLGMRNDKTVFSGIDSITLRHENKARRFGLMHVEYVFDNTLNPTMNIWDGLRYKFYLDFNTELTKPLLADHSQPKGRTGLNAGFDARYYVPIYRNFIWAGRAAGDFSWGDQKMIYYLGGIDNWLMFGANTPMSGNRPYRFFDANNKPAEDVDYTYQTLAENLRGFVQNAANGNNNIVINSEFRFPVFTTLLNKPINNAFIRNFQLTQFVDLGTAWNGNFNKIGKPDTYYTDPRDPNTVRVKIPAPGIGPFLGGYGFGVRSTLLGYFLKVDLGWPMRGFFEGKPIWYFSMGLDF